MGFDSKQLWWPPFGRLYNQLSAAKQEPSAEAAAALETSLKEYEGWLAKGVSGFRPPSEGSRKALETESALAIGDKKMPIDPALRRPAAELSRHLGLDEVQAYILLRRWAAASGAGSGSGKVLPAGGLTAAQLRELAELYARERMCLLKATEGLLWLGEEIGSGPFPDVVESTLAQLLEAGLEDATFQSLQANLEGPKALAASTALAAPDTGYSSLFGVGGSGGGGWGAGAGTGGGGAAAAGVSDEQLATERCSLLSILTLIYYHPRKQCTPDRFLALARLFHTHLFSVPLPRLGAVQLASNGSSEVEPTPAKLALKLAAVLLLEMLDVDKALAAVAEGTPLTEDTYAFGAAATRKKVNAELSSWWGAAGTAHSPILLAWAAVLCLVGKSASEGGGLRVGPEEYGGHAQQAHEAGALGVLGALTSHAGLAPNAAEMASNILLSVLSAVVCAFDLSPLSMPLPLTEQAVAVMCNLYQGQPALCDSFWAEERLSEEPLRHFLADVRGLFPAFPAMLYRLLTALSATPDSAVAANAYLAGVQALVCLHSVEEGGIMVDDSGDGSSAYTDQVVALPGSRALTLPQGVQGEVLPLPEGLLSLQAVGALSVWQGRSDLGEVATPEAAFTLVRWTLPLAEGTGQWVLLCRAFEAVASLQQVAGAAMDATPPPPAAAAAVAELSAALRLLCALCSCDPQTALELLHVEVPAGGDAGVAEGGGPDILTLATHAVAMLCQLAEPPLEAIGDCFGIMTALVQSIPGRVHQELLAVLQLAGGLLAEAAEAQDIPALSRLLVLEAAQGRFPATRAFLQLVTALLSSGAAGRELQVYVVFVLRRVLGEHHRWRYASRGERWRLAGAALRLLRHALAAGAPPAEAAEALLRYDVDLAAYLLPALPPPAKALERMDFEPLPEAEIVAVEDCCLEWMRLLPVLLPPAAAADPEGPGDGGSGRALGAGAFFRQADGPAAPCAAAVLLSYLAYEFFGTAERTLVLQAACALASAAAQAAPGLAFAALLPSAEGATGPSAAVRALFAAALSPQQAAQHPQLAAGVCSLLGLAVQSHASLADALLFPCKLERAQKENRDGNALAQPAKKGDAVAAAADKERGSCLDALWALLQAAGELQKDAPAVLAALLRLLSAMWQSGVAAFRPVALLRQQPGVWRHLTAALSAATAAPDGSIVPAGAGAEDGGSSAPAWGQKDDTAWVLAAEASALQIVATECFMAAASHSPAEALPKELQDILRKEGAALPALLRRYCMPLPTAALLGRLRGVAAAAGLQLLGEALADELVWPSLVAAPSIVASLHAAAAPLLGQFGSRAGASGALAEHAAAIVERNGDQPAVAAVAEAVLALAEVPARLAEGRQLGAGYAFDSQRCLRRLGGVLSSQSQAVQALPAWLDAASVAASLEDSRLAAATALKALLSGLHRYSARLEPAAGKGLLQTPTPAQLGDCLATLADAAQDVIEHSQLQPPAAAGEKAEGLPAAHAAAAQLLDVHSVHIAGAAEAAYAVLLLLRRWAAKEDAGGEAARIELSTRLLELVSRWLGALGDVQATSRAAGAASLAALRSLTTSLLAAALLALEGLTPLEDAPLSTQGSPARAALQGAAQQCLPALLASCLRQREHLAEAAALATAVMESCVPAPLLLPLIRANLNLGALLAELLKSLITRGFKRAGAAVAAANPQAAAAQGQPLLLPPPPAAAAAPSSAEDSTEEGREEKAALLLALKVAQAPGGALLLLEQGVVGHALLLCQWLLAPEGGNLMGETLVPAGALNQPVDYSNAYRQDGTHDPAHQLWCSALSLLGLLLAALPGYEAVERAALELAVAGAGRLQLAVEPPAATRQQPITLGILQETRYTLFFLTALARLSGRWRALLPGALPQLRQASATLLEWAAHAHASHHAAAVSTEERAAAKAGAEGAAGVKGGWVQAFEHGQSAVGSALALQLAERLYGCAQCALSFQLATAPEVSEEEAGLLGPDWASPAALAALQEQCLPMLAAVARPPLAPAQRRLLRTLGSVVAGAAQLEQAMAVQVSHQQRVRVSRTLEQLSELLQQE